MIRISHIAPLLATALVCLTACGTGSPGGKEAQAPAEFSAKDASFVNHARTLGLEEVAFARLAAAKATNPAVRNWAGSMIADLTPINEQVATVIQTKGLMPPTEMDERHAVMLQHLQSLSGPTFDRGYLDGQLQELTMMIQSFQAAADSGSDPQVRSLARQNIPVLFQRLQAASVIAGL